MLVVSCWLELASHPRAEIPTASLSLGDNPTPIPDSPDIIRACGSQVRTSRSVTQTGTTLTWARLTT